MTEKEKRRVVAMTEEFLNGSRVEFYDGTHSYPLIKGRICEKHFTEHYHRIAISDKEAEKLSKSRHRDWEQGRGRLWVNNKRIKRSCRLNRGGKE